MLHYCNDHLNVPTKDDETGDNAAAGEANGTGAAAEGENAESGAPPAAGADESSPTASGATDEAQPNGTAEDAKSDEPTPDTHQAFAVLGLALIAMGEDVGAQMSLRSLNHLVRLPLTCLWLVSDADTDVLWRACDPASRSAGLGPLVRFEPAAHHPRHAFPIFARQRPGRRHECHLCHGTRRRRVQPGQAGADAATTGRLLPEGGRLPLCRADSPGPGAHGQGASDGQPGTHRPFLDEPNGDRWSPQHHHRFYRRSKSCVWLSRPDKDSRAAQSFSRRRTGCSTSSPWRCTRAFWSPSTR
jgi:hypothetical protein